MIERGRDGSLPEDAPATRATDDPKDEQEDKDKDAAVDEQSEQSMDGSDAPAW